MLHKVCENWGVDHIYLETAFPLTSCLYKISKNNQVADNRHDWTNTTY